MTTISINGLIQSKNLTIKVNSIINQNTYLYYVSGLCGIKNVEEIYISDLRMDRVGNGSYYKKLTIYLNGKKTTVSQYSNDSQMYDYLYNTDDIHPKTYNNYMKKFLVSMLEMKIDAILENTILE